MENTLVVENLKTYFDGAGGILKAVDGISFSIEKGETFALVGESGCGKSLTALSLMQLLPEGAYIAGGNIFLNGIDLVPLNETEKRSIRGSRISMIFQEPMTSLNPVFTAGFQIAETIKIHQRKSFGEAKALAVEMLKKVHLAEDVYDEYPHRLSGGMRQRVMIAIALACRPDLLIADEPTTALDVTIQADILKLIRELKADLGASVLLITHNLALVSENAQKAAVMYAGKIVEMSGVKTLFRNPSHPYTLKLLRSLPAFEKRGAPLDAIPGSVPRPEDFPVGCRFSTRCPKEMSGCSTVVPRFLEIETGHFVACHLYDKEFMERDYSMPLKKGIEPLSRLAALHGEREVLVEIKNLKGYFPIKKGLLKRTVGHVKAVDGIDMTIRKGSTVALVGESGCGKTTVGKTILKLLEPTDGKIIFDGADITGLKRKELKPYRSFMQIIFQDPYSSLNPRLKIGEIIQEGIKSLMPKMGKKERLKKAESSLEMVNLTPDMIWRYPHEFSGGQRQRISIARALAVEPMFIVCDEITSALDVSIQAQILNLLKSIQREFGQAFLFITHDLSIVEYIADEVMVMYDGKIVERGTVEEIFSNPKEPYTKRLISSLPRLDYKD